MMVPVVLLDREKVQHFDRAAAAAQAAIDDVVSQLLLDVPILGLPIATGLEVAGPREVRFVPALASSPAATPGSPAETRTAATVSSPKPVNAGPLAALATRRVRPSALLTRLLAPGRFAYHEMVRRFAAQYSVQLPLVMAIIASESGGDPEALSPQGAIGLMQLMPETAERLGVDPWDPEQNVEGAVRYLSSLLSDFESVDLSLIAYNAGPGFAMQYRKGKVELGAETRAFLIRVGRLLQ
jgi:soluble lytic murein transglycosylase-like protein